MLRKRNKTIHTYFESGYIQLQLSNHQWIEGRLKKIKADSLFIDQMLLRQVGNFWGLPTVDTMRLGLYKIHINEVYAMPKEKESFAFFRNGVLFQAAGAGYMGLNIINGLGKSEPVFEGDNLGKLGIAAGVFAVGTLLSATYKNTCVLGKKYMLYTSANISVK